MSRPMAGQIPITEENAKEARASRPACKKGTTMQTANNESLVVNYGALTLDFAAIPHTSLMAMLRRGVTHYFGSEQASKVTGHFDPDNYDAAKNEVAPTDTPEARATFKAECVAKAHEALLAGTVGVSTRGPAIDPVEKIAQGIAKAEILAILKKAKLAWPKKPEDKITFPNGDAFTGQELIARRLAKEGDRINKDAKAEHAKRVREAEKRAKAAESVATEGLAAL